MPTMALNRRLEICREALRARKKVTVQTAPGFRTTPEIVLLHAMVPIWEMAVN